MRPKNKRDINRNRKSTAFENLEKKIIQNFPNVELSYEKISHKKVQNDTKNIIYMTIPYGPKYFAWFTTLNGHPKCYFLEINLRGKYISNIHMEFNVCFSPYLCSGKGTILYGTLFEYEHQKMFNVENIYYFKGDDVGYLPLLKRLELYRCVMEEMRQVAYTRRDVVFGLPVMDVRFAEVESLTRSLPYKVYALQQRYLVGKSGGRKHGQREVIYNFRLTPRDAAQTKTVVVAEQCFMVTADPCMELYWLHTRDSQKYALMGVQTYEQSIMMNGLFRSVRENTNIDYIEESEDEDEFQDITENKYTDVEKRICMICRYDRHIKKWMPVKVVATATATDEPTHRLTSRKDAVAAERYGSVN